MLLLLLAPAVLPAAETTDVLTLLKGVESRYNATKTLQVNFTETYSLPGRARTTESGLLTLRKPGKMRWAYTNPPGKLFVSDGKFIYSYSPESNRAEQMPFKETEDMRAPLAFLLGKLEFSRDFKEYRSRREGDDTFITAVPKSDKLPYSEVSFVVSGRFVIKRLIVTGQDRSVLDFTFENEKVNPPVNDSLFTFTPPKGAEVVVTSGNQ